MSTAEQHHVPVTTQIMPPRVSADVLDKVVEETVRRQTVSWKTSDTGETLTLSISHVRKLIAHPTKRGHLPTDRDCWLFLQMCKARGLNPYVGDAYLIGYDSDDGPSFTLITAHQALLKRAEASGKKKGMQSGVIVLAQEHGPNGEVTHLEKERNGDFYLPDTEQLVGAWCKVYRADWDYPQYERIRLATYNKGRSLWKSDPAGMIVKVAEASAHRLAFPAEVGGMYIREEMDSAHAPPAEAKPAGANLDDLADQLLDKTKNGGTAVTPIAQEPSQTPPVDTQRAEGSQGADGLPPAPPSPRGAPSAATAPPASEYEAFAKRLNSAPNESNFRAVCGEIAAAFKAGKLSQDDVDNLDLLVDGRRGDFEQGTKRKGR